MPRGLRLYSLPMGFMARRLSLIVARISQPCSPALGPWQAAQPENWLGRSDGETMTSVYLDEIQPGMSATIERTVTERDVQLFSESTGDMNPVHFDEEFARKTVFRGRVAHGALSIGFISALLGTKLPGDGSIFLSASIVFKLPVRIGDTVVTTATVREINGRAVVMDCVCTVDDKQVLASEAHVLAPRRPVGPKD